MTRNDAQMFLKLARLTAPLPINHADSIALAIADLRIGEFDACMRRMAARDAADLESESQRIERKLARMGGIGARVFAMGADVALALGCSFVTLAVGIAQITGAL